MLRLFVALTFILTWVTGNAKAFGTLLLSAVLGPVIGRPTSPEVIQAIGLLMLMGSLILPAAMALLILWITPVRRFLRSSVLAHRVLEIGIALSCIRVVILSSASESLWKEYLTFSSALYTISSYALLVLMIGVVLVFLIGKPYPERAPIVEPGA